AASAIMARTRNGGRESIGEAWNEKMPTEPTDMPHPTIDQREDENRSRRDSIVESTRPPDDDGSGLVSGEARPARPECEDTGSDRKRATALGNLVSRLFLEAFQGQGRPPRIADQSGDVGVGAAVEEPGHSGRERLGVEEVADEDQIDSRRLDISDVCPDQVLGD